MIGFASDWLKTLRGLGESFLGVLRAEIEAFQRDAAASAKLVLKGARLVILALVFLFWLVGTLVFAGIALVSSALGVALWQAGLIVGAVLLLGVVVMRFWAVAVFRQVETPGTLLRDHVKDHQDWLKDELGVDEDD
jgi:hypothetical protein